MITIKCTRLLTTAIFLLITVSAMAQPAAKLALTNPLAIERTDELIVLPKKMLEQKLGKIAQEKFVVFKNKTGQPMLAQYDDMNGDGVWDEAVLLYSFKPKETATITIALSNQPAAIRAVVRAHVRLRKKNADESFGPSLVSETMPLKNPATDFTKQP
ncbi:MAG: DUF4861 family protein, partial [Ferruginibacter sp.]